MPTDIERTMAALINELVKDRLEIDPNIVVDAWREYASYWPNLEPAMRELQVNLVAMFEDDKDIIVKIGQCMKNLDWSLLQVRAK